jgi:general secretion pathway protein K
MKRLRQPRKPKDRGAALVLVLWGSVVMAIIAAAAARQAYTSAVVVNAGSELVRTRALADGGIRAAWSAYADGQINDHTALWGCRAGDDVLLVRVQPEIARVDINMASEEMLAALYNAAGLDEQPAGDLAAATIDYRNFGDGAEDSGAQVVQGTARIPDGTFRRGPFQTIEELGYLPGMDAALFRALADDITVEGRSSDVDLDNASLLVKRAFEAAARRDVGSVARAAPRLSGEPAFEGSLMHVRSIAMTAAGGVFVREGVVEGPFDREGTPTLLRLVQGSLNKDERLPAVGDAPSCAEGFVLVQRLDN